MYFSNFIFPGLNTPLDIYNTIRILRRQRPGLVQTAEQYKSIYIVLDYYIDTVMKRMKETKVGCSLLCDVE